MSFSSLIVSSSSSFDFTEIRKFNQSMNLHFWLAQEYKWRCYLYERMKEGRPCAMDSHMIEDNMKIPC